MADEATKADDNANIEKVNVGWEAVPFADVYFAESSTGTIHLFNGLDVVNDYWGALRADKPVAEITSMCGGYTIEVTALESEDPRDAVEDELTHLADHIDVETLTQNWDLMNNPHRALDSDDLCHSCKASWNKAFNDSGDYRTVRYTKTGEWEA